MPLLLVPLRPVLFTFILVNQFRVNVPILIGIIVTIKLGNILLKRYLSRLVIARFEQFDPKPYAPGRF